MTITKAKGCCALLFGASMLVALAACTTDQIPRVAISDLPLPTGHPIVTDEANPAFLNALWQPESRIPLEVGTASFREVRRYLVRGILPPPEAVRLAELINYFNSEVVHLPDDQPIGATIEEGPCLWDQSHRLVRVGVHTRRPRPENIQPRNLVFLIDVSASMFPEGRMPLVRAALRTLVPQLNDQDRIAIVTFGGDTIVRLPSLPGNEIGKILKQVDSLRPMEGPNDSSGIQLAYAQARTGFLEKGVNRVIMVTAGEAPPDMSDVQDWRPIAREQAEAGIMLSVIGVGTHPSSLPALRQLAGQGNGALVLIDDVEKARKIFLDGGGTFTPVARDVQVRVEFNPNRIASYRLLGYEHRQDTVEPSLFGQDFAVNLSQAQDIIALYEVNPATAPQETGQQPRPAVMVKLGYQLIEGGARKEIVVPMADSWASLFPSPHFRFTAMVAQFSLQLRKQVDPRKSSFTSTLHLARDLLGKRPQGIGSDFLKLILSAEAIEKAGQN